MSTVVLTFEKQKALAHFSIRLEIFATEQFIYQFGIDLWSSSIII
jgi:hypothetical protein